MWSYRAKCYLRKTSSMLGCWEDQSPLSAGNQLDEMNHTAFLIHVDGMNGLWNLKLSVLSQHFPPLKLKNCVYSSLYWNLPPPKADAPTFAAARSEMQCKNRFVPMDNVGVVPLHNEGTLQSRWHTHNLTQHLKPRWWLDYFHVYILIYLSINLSIYLAIYLFTYLSTYQSIYLSTYLSIYLWSKQGDLSL